MATGIREMGLSSAMHQTMKHLHRVGGLPMDARTTLMMCWIVGTYVGPLFAPYSYLCIQSDSETQRKDKLLEVIGALSHWYPFYMCATRQQFTYSGTMRVTPTVFTNLAPLPRPLEERSFLIRVDQWDPGLAPSMHTASEAALELIRHQLKTVADQSSEQIEFLYRDQSGMDDVLHDFEPYFRDMARPLLVMATLADRTPRTGPLLVPALLRGLHEVKRPLTREGFVEGRGLTVIEAGGNECDALACK